MLIKALIEWVHLVQTRPLLLRRHVLTGSRQVQNRIGLGSEYRALIRRRQEAVLPVRRAGIGSAFLVQDDHKTRKVLVLAAQAVGDPGARAGEAHLDRAGVPLVVGNHVIVRKALAGMNECQIVHDRADIREYFRDPSSRFSVLLEAERALHERSGVALANLDLAVSIHRHAVVLLERRFVPEGVEVAYAPPHAKRYYRFRACFEMRRLLSD